MRKILLLALVFVTSFAAFGQDFSNKGKDFWVGYGYHQQMTNGGGGGSQDMVLYFATEQVTNITISIPATGYIQNITTGAGNGVVTSATIPKSGINDARLLTEGLSSKGIHITSDKPMVAYAHIYNASVSGATILYPTNTLGREYYSVNYKNWSNTTNANCWFYVVATDTGTTTLKITPKGNTVGGWIAGTTYTVNLTQGQIYNVMAALIVNSNCGGANQPPCTSWDLTGSQIQSINTGNGCKKIAVFSGSGRISITCTNFASSSDNYMVQAMPKNAWGKKYLTLPAFGNQANNIYRVCVSNPAAIVKINGSVTALPLQSNFFYEIPSTNQPQLIEADSAIMVAQYFTSQNACGNGSPGDPEVIYLSAVEQNINKVLWNATPNFAITLHNFNVVVPNTGTGVSSFKLDGISVPAASFIVHPQDPNYSYLRYRLTTGGPNGSGFHYIESDSGFNAIAYGFGGTESYGYNAGTNIKDLYQQIGVQTTYGIETTPSVCTNSPFKFKVSLPYIPDSMQWNFNGAAGMLPNNNTVYVNNIPNTEDSSTVVNGRTIHWYSIPLQYTFTTIGTYPITIRTFVPNGECGSVQDIDFDLAVSNPPVPGFTWTAGGCVAEPYQFIETTPQFPKATYKFWWKFGDPGSGPNNDTSNLRNPVHLFSAPGTYTVRYGSITTPGCLSDTISQTVIVPDIPFATISGINTTVCINSAPPPDVTFTATEGTPPFTFTYNINGGAAQTINSIGTNYSVTIQHPTNVANSFIYNLTKVQNVGSTACARNINNQSVTVNILADATVTLRAGDNDNQTVCINNPIVNIRYDVGGSGTGGAVSGLPAGVTGTYAGGVITIAGTPTVPGIFNYTVTTTGPCITPQTTGTITVNDDAVISLVSPAGSDNQTKCINTAIDNIDYLVVGIATGATIAWLPGVPPGITFTNLGGGNFRIAGTPTASGTFNYTVNTTGPCIKPTATGSLVVTADATVTLRPGDNDNQTVCINNAIVNIRYDVAGSGTGGSVAGLPAGVTGTYAGGVITISGAPTVFGVFNYTVSTTGPCITPQATGTITVTGNGTITLSSAAGSDNQILCINTPLLVNITYAVAGTSTGGSVSGLPAGVTGVYAGGVITISGTPTVAGVFNYTVSTTGPCVNPTATGTITVTGDGTITLTSAVGTDNQTRCINVAITNITYAVGGTGTGGSVSGLPPGVTGVFAGGVITISGTPTLIGTYNYTVTTTGPCVIPTRTGTITVNPDASIVLTSVVPTTSQELCRNSTITNITYAIAGGGTGAGATGLPAGVTGVYAAGVFTISGSPTVAGLFNYTVTTTGTCVQNSLSGSILVNQLPTAAFTYTAPSCETRVISFTDASVANVGLLDQWIWDFGDPASGPINNTSNLPNPVHVFAAAGPYTVTLTVRNNKGCISNPIANVVVNINNRPQAGFIIPEVCLSDTYAQFLDTSKLTNAVIDQWDWNFGDPFATILNPNTSNQKNPTHSYTAVGPYTVRLIVWNFAKVCRDTIIQTLIVNGSFPVANYTVNNPATLCANDSVGIVEASTVFPGVITKVEIYWDNMNFPAVFQIDNNPFTGKTYRHLYPNFQAPLTKVFQIRYRAYSGGICVNDKLGFVTVNAAPRVQFNNIPNTCYLVAPFQLTQPGNGGVPGSGVFSGPGVSPTGIFNPQAAGVGTHTILYTYTSSAAGCKDTMSKTITVLDTAHATFSVTLPSCEQISTSFTNQSTAPASVILASTVWNFGDVTGSQTFAIASPVNHTYANPGSYTVTMHTVSTTPPTPGCLSTDTSMVVTIDANHHIAWDATSGSQTQALCVNTGIVPIRYTLTGGATNVNFVPSLPAGLSYTVGGTPLTLTISGAPTTPAGFTFSIQTTGNTCVTDIANVTITVAPDHAIALTSAAGTDNQTVCINTPIVEISYLLSGGANNVTFTPALPAWLVPNVAGNILTLNGSPTSTVGSPFNFTIQTTGNACQVATAIFAITVDPNHAIALTSAAGTDNQTVCINTPIVEISYLLSGGANNVTFTPALPAWLVPNVAGNILTLNGSPTSATGSPFTYTIQTTGNTCLVAMANITISVNPDDSITLTSGNNMQSVCVNSPIDDITYDLGGGAVGPVTFTPSVLPPGITSFVSGNVLTIRGTPTSTAGGPVFNYTITTNGGCLQANASFQIQVHPYPVPDFAFDKGSYCIPNAVVGFINNTTPTPLSNYTYEWDFGDGGFSTAVSPTHPYTSKGPFTVILTARSTVLLNGGVIGCESSMSSLLDIIHPQPKADFVFSKPAGVCIGDNVLITDATDNQDGLPDKYFWNLGDGTTESTYSFTHTYPDTATYIITMYTVNSFGCNSDTINKLPLVGLPYKPFTVYPYPHVSAGPDKNVLEGGSVQLDAKAYAIQPQYSWTPVEYLTDSKILQPRVVNPKTDMTYRLTVTGKGGCQFSDDVFVKLLKFPAIPNTFSPNNDGINDTWRIDYLNSYPDNRVQIFTRAGKLVFESRGYTTPWDGTLKGKPLPFDTYYYIIEPGNGRDPITGYVTILK